MIFKNSFKNFFLAGAIYGVAMGCVFGLIYLSPAVGIISGIAAGFLFGGLIYLFNIFAERKFNKKREEISAKRRIICDGAATLNGNGGWLYLTELGLEFYPHKLNLNTSEMIFPTDLIQSVETKKPNTLVVSTKMNLKYKFVVVSKEQWAEQIRAYILTLPQ